MPRDQKATRLTASACGAGQAKCRGGCSGGGRASSSAIISSSARNRSRVGSLIAMAWVDGPACKIFNMQIATSGQSWQSLLFCLSGQHGISAIMSAPSAICIILAGNECPATTGMTSGAIVRPAVTRRASKSLNDCGTVMVRHSHTRRALGRSPALTNLAAGRNGRNHDPSCRGSVYSCFRKFA
jgi:hypothetical protein